MIPSPVYTHPNALNWYGFDISVREDKMSIGMGRIGRSYNPIINDDGKISGGWFSSGASFPIFDNTRQIDLVLYQSNIYFMVLSDDMNDTVPEEIELVLTLAWRVGNDWYYAHPVR